MRSRGTGPVAGGPAARPVTRLAFAALTSLAVAGCVGTGGGDAPRVAIVRDLSSVAGCRFVGSVQAPPIQTGLRSAAGYEAYLDALRRATFAQGGTHLYMLNEAAGWGAARAIGAAYACVAG